MKEYCSLARHIPASLPNNFYIVNINMFTYKMKLQLTPGSLPEISNIRIFGPLPENNPDTPPRARGIIS
jgi:hypothetical protein